MDSNCKMFTLKVIQDDFDAQTHKSCNDIESKRMAVDNEDNNT